MESKNVKVIDEHGIDRVANVICSIGIDGSDYVIYWIERDSENDNLFISKLIKNNDGTSNMINIDDSFEKGKLSDIVKELITNAINDENDKMPSSKIIIKNGKTINVSNVLFNKEQNINVQKTYITTVKKSVTKVGESYYRVDSTSNDFTEINDEQIFVEGKKEEGTTQPVIEPVTTPVVQEEIVNEIPVPVPVIPEVSTEPVSTVDSKINIIGADNDNQNVPPVVASTSTQESVSVQLEEPKPINQNSDIKAPEDKLFFDGSKETNLSSVLDEVAAEPSIAVPAVESIREFGQDEPILTEEESNNGMKHSSGFANNRFFIVMAIVFFLAACVFLGYEVFNYFQM